MTAIGYSSKSICNRISKGKRNIWKTLEKSMPRLPMFSLPCSEGILPSMDLSPTARCHVCSVCFQGSMFVTQNLEFLLRACRYHRPHPPPPANSRLPEGKQVFNQKWHCLHKLSEQTGIAGTLSPTQCF